MTYSFTKQAFYNFKEAFIKGAVGNNSQYTPEQISQFNTIHGGDKNPRNAFNASSSMDRKKMDTILSADLNDPAKASNPLTGRSREIAFNQQTPAPAKPVVTPPLTPIAPIAPAPDNLFTQENDYAKQQAKLAPAPAISSVSPQITEEPYKPLTAPASPITSPQVQEPQNDLDMGASTIPQMNLGSPITQPANPVSNDREVYDATKNQGAINQAKNRVNHFNNEYAGGSTVGDKTQKVTDLESNQKHLQSPSVNAPAEALQANQAAIEAEKKKLNGLNPNSTLKQQGVQTAKDMEAIEADSQGRRDALNRGATVQTQYGTVSSTPAPGVAAGTLPKGPRQKWEESAYGQEQLAKAERQKQLQADGIARAEARRKTRNEQWAIQNNRPNPEVQSTSIATSNQQLSRPFNGVSIAQK